MAKRYKLNADAIAPLAEGYGGCFATDRITVDGARVGYMYREEPDNDIDSGWRFLAGDEDDAYIDDPDRLDVYDVNTIANYDRDIIAFLDSPIGSAFARISPGGALEPVDDS
jgi:hypothetical protein